MYTCTRVHVYEELISWRVVAFVVVRRWVGEKNGWLANWLVGEWMMEKDGVDVVDGDGGDGKEGAKQYCLRKARL